MRIPFDTRPFPWGWVSVDQITTMIQYGTSARTSDERQDAVRVLRMGNIVDGQIDYKKLKYLPSGHSEFPELLLEDGDILFNRTNSAELVGKTAVYRGVELPTSFASYLIRVRTVGYLPDLLSAYINSAFGREWVSSVVSQQVGQANVNGTKLRELGVPVMPATEQAEIWRRLAMAFSHINLLASEAARASALVDRLDQAVLTKAFRGDLVTEDRAADTVATGSSTNDI
jgi:type I restriction enzyme, S subunit